MTNLLVNVVPCLFIVGVAIWAIATEYQSLQRYKKQDCAVTEMAISFLEKSDRQGNYLSISETEVGLPVIEWMFNYLEGERDRQGFTVRLQNNYFILLSYPAILGRSVPRSPVHFAPTLLTALGIFGTFLGISIGMGQISISDIKDPQQLVSVSSSLLGGMKLAFLTSLLGLLGAIPLMFILASNTKQKERYRDRLRQRLNGLAFVETSERILSELSDSGISAIADLAEAAKSLRQANNFTPNVITDAIKEAIRTETSLAIAELKSLKELQKNQGQTVELLIKQLRDELIEPVVERLDRSAHLTQQASEAVVSLKNELGDISQSLAGAVETIQVFQKDTLTDLQKFAFTLSGILNNFQAETKGVLQEVGTEINRAVAESVLGMEAQRQAFAESASTASQTFKGIREDLEVSLCTQSEQQKVMLQEVESQTRKILQDASIAFQDQSETLKVVGSEASQLMNGAKDNLLGTLTNIDKMLQNTRQTVQEELQVFRVEYQSALTSFFSEQNNLLDLTLGRQREGLAQVVIDLQDTFASECRKREEMSAGVDNSLTKITATVKSVEELASAIGINSSERLGQLQEIARTVGDEAHRVEKSYQKMTEQFDRALIKGNEQLADYLKNANQTYSTTLQEIDGTAASFCNKLDETSQSLLNVAEYLAATATNLRDSEGRN